MEQGANAYLSMWNSTRRNLHSTLGDLNTTIRMITAPFLILADPLYEERGLSGHTIS